jgi:hypothetical protein
MAYDYKFRVKSLGSTVRPYGQEGLSVEFLDSGVRVEGLEFKIRGFGFMVVDQGFKVCV